jgi:predicted O-methyltransferase YrrM
LSISDFRLQSEFDDPSRAQMPAALEGIQRDTVALGFPMASEPRTGSLLRTLAACKPEGRFLELGTGTGIGTAWLLAGMDARSHLDSVDSNATVSAVAQRHLAHDPRITFHIGDGAQFLTRLQPGELDFVYADAWPGKFVHLDLALSLLRTGGIYFVDDLLPQSNWPADHPSKVEALVATLESRRGFVATRLGWASGLMLLVRVDRESNLQPAIGNLQLSE